MQIGGAGGGEGGGVVERALRESEERCRAVIEVCGEGIVKRRRDGRITAMNPAAERLLGMTRRQLEDLDPPPAGLHTIREDGSLLPVAERPSRVALRTGQPVSQILGVHRPDGSVTWLHVNAQPLRRAPEEEPFAVVTVFTDVTLQREQAAEIERQRQQLARSLESSSLGSWEWDLRNDRVSYNALWPEILGYGPDDVEPTCRAWARLVHPEDWDRAHSVVVAAVKRQAPHLEVEYRMRSRDGGWRWIHTRAKVVEWSDRGRALRMAGTHADVTLRREAEDRLHAVVAQNEQLVAELRMSENRLRLALASGQHAEWEWHVRTGVIVLGARVWEMLGVGGGGGARGESVGALLAMVHPEDAERLRAGMQACADGRQPELEERFRARHASGSWRWLRTRGCAVEHDTSGRPTRIVGTTTDVTERKELQEKLLAATRLASVGTLAAGVAHEINNPLAWLSANLEHGLERLAESRTSGAPPSATDRETLEQLLGEALEGARRIASVVKSMRSLGRPEPVAEEREVDVAAEIHNAIQMVRNQLVQRARLEVSVAPDLPPVRARTSELGRVFVNLLVNAAQAIPEGCPAQHRISISARVQDGAVVARVSDTGSGIDASVRERLFEAFFTTKPVGVGTGLGLAIAKNIVESVGGHIAVESAVGRGTTFSVRLPLHRAAAASAALAPVPSSAPAVARRRVALVDDEPLVGRSMARWLRRTHDVTVFTSASEALARLDAGERWDAILCDVMMPGMDGVAFYEAVRARWPALTGRVAFLTGGIFGERVPAFLAEHDVAALTKPLERQQVLSAIESLAAA